MAGSQPTKVGWIQEGCKIYLGSGLMCKRLAPGNKVYQMGEYTMQSSSVFGPWWDRRMIDEAAIWSSDLREDKGGGM